MNHQITLEELGIITKQIDRSAYTCPCGGCVCEHCSNNVDCIDKCTGEADFGCFNCDDCRNYPGEGTDNWKSDCDEYKVTNHQAEHMRKRFKKIKN